MLKSVVDDTYDWFVGLVADRRNIPEAEARRLADGSIYTGRQALRLKLIDDVGGDPEARAWLANAKDVPEDLPTREWKPDESLSRRCSRRARLPALHGSSELTPAQPEFYRADLQLTVSYPFGRLRFSGRSDR